MKRLAIAAAVVALALLTFFQFPGHTYLRQDSQIYLPILEHLRDPSVLANDILAEHPHVAFTLYDEAALSLRKVTGLSFREVLEGQQIATRALGIWGIYLMATALGLSTLPALLVASICSLGAAIAGPTVLTVEYEPTPRAFALPLLLCAMGLAAHRRYLAAGVAAAGAFLYHPPTALPVLGLLVLLALWPGKPAAMRQRLAGLAPLAGAAVVLWLAARGQAGQGEAQALFGHLTATAEGIQRMRAPYVWVSTWPHAVIAHYLLLFAIVLAVYARLRRDLPFELRLFVLGLPLLAIFSMPVSWLLLEQGKWALLPQLQPLRTVLFLALIMQFLTAAAGVVAAGKHRFAESAGWFVLAYLLPLQPVITTGLSWGRLALVVALAGTAAAALQLAGRTGLRFAPLAAVAAFFLIPALGGTSSDPRPETPELAGLCAWASGSTSSDAVFLFPDARRATYPGMFRADALRAVYVDWKGGGQVNFLTGLGEQWWQRWQQTMARGFQPADAAKYSGLGIDYVVLRPPHRLPRQPAFENAAYVVYRVR